MALQSLTPPQDITWNRMAFSRDMVDTNFEDMNFPPKWRSSLTVYYYIVPEEETADAYPNSRIVYLKLSCSITGWNPNEDLLDIKKEAGEADLLDDLQKSIWEAVEASGWASKYWGCHGAIMQIGVFPSKGDDVGPDDYPYIMDFEPKKRELYESVTEGSEVLSGSSDRLSTTKGITHTASVEHGSGISIYGLSADHKIGYQYQHQNIETKDKLQEDRISKSHSTTFSQMYQLFNGYHLGTNRAVFVVAPRPHTANSTFNLIDGERKLEGIQDMFIIVNMPRDLKGFCIQATLDTGHKNPEDHVSESSINKISMIQKGDFSDPPCMGEIIPTPQPPIPPGGGGGGGNTTTPPEFGSEFIVTRRTIQSCGTFNENGAFTVQKGGTSVTKLPPVFVGEKFLPTKYVMHNIHAKELNPPEGGFDDCKERTSFRYNYNLSRLSKSMVEIFSSGNNIQKDFKDTETFKSLFALAARQINIPIEELLKLKYINKREYELLKKFRVESVKDLFKESSGYIVEVDIIDIIRRFMRVKR